MRLVNLSAGKPCCGQRTIPSGPHALVGDIFRRDVGGDGGSDARMNFFSEFNLRHILQSISHVTDGVEEGGAISFFDLDGDGNDGTGFSEDKVHCTSRDDIASAGCACHTACRLVHDLGGHDGRNGRDGGECTAIRVAVSRLGVCDAAIAWERGECR